MKFAKAVYYVITILDTEKFGVHECHSNKMNRTPERYFLLSAYFTQRKLRKKDSPKNDQASYIYQFWDNSILNI